MFSFSHNGFAFIKDEFYRMNYRLRIFFNFDSPFFLIPTKVGGRACGAYSQDCNLLLLLLDIKAKKDMNSSVKINAAT